MSAAGGGAVGALVTVGTTVVALLGIAALGGGGASSQPCAAATGPTVSASAGTAAPTCEPGSSGEVVGGWTRPLVNATTISSGYGMRYHPLDHVWRLHAGTDMPKPCGTPIYAAAAGTVIAAAGSGVSMQRDLVMIDHGGGLTTSYMHEYTNQIYVAPGDVVTAGQHISDVGNAGKSAGCHLHYEVRQDGASMDPEPFMAAQGVPLP